MISSRTTNGWELVEIVPEHREYKVLMLPGLQGSDLVFDKLMKSESIKKSDIHIIAGNPPGFKGLSVPEGFDFSVENYASLYEQIAENEKIDLIIGHSFSGNILIEVAARNNYRGKLMIISPSLYKNAETKELLMLESLSKNKLLSGVMWWITYQMMASVFKPYFSNKEELALAVENGKKIPRTIAKRILLGYFAHIEKHGNLTNRLLNTKIPVCYLRGTLDDIKFTDEDKNKLISNPLIHYKEVEGARHFAMIDKPEEVGKVVIEFLKS